MVKVNIAREAELRYWELEMEITGIDIDTARRIRYVTDGYPGCKYAVFTEERVVITRFIVLPGTPELITELAKLENKITEEREKPNKKEG